jgi:hypothetical protein
MTIGNDLRLVWQLQEAVEESQSQRSLGTVPLNGHRGAAGVRSLPKARFMFQDSPRQRIQHRHVIQPFPSRDPVLLKPPIRAELTGDSPSRFDASDGRNHATPLSVCCSRNHATQSQCLLLELIALHAECIPDSVTGRLLALMLP